MDPEAGAAIHGVGGGGGEWHGERAEVGRVLGGADDVEALGGWADVGDGLVCGVVGSLGVAAVAFEDGSSVLEEFSGAGVKGEG